MIYPFPDIRPCQHDCALWLWGMMHFEQKLYFMTSYPCIAVAFKVTVIFHLGLSANRYCFADGVFSLPCFLDRYKAPFFHCKF